MDRPIFKNEIVSFTHPYNEELRNLLFGKTKVNINGEDRMVPNFYFKYEWLNEENEIERGYFLKYEYEDNPTLEFQIANEEIIIGQESNTPEIIPTVEGEFNSDYSNDYNN